MVIAAACLLACIPGASAFYQDIHTGQSTGSHAITLGQAKESIRAFMGDTSLEPEYLVEGEDVAGYYYLFCIGYKQLFMVNEDSGVVEGVLFWENMAPLSPETKINRNTSFAMAQRYADLKCDNFSTKTWALVVDKIAGPADGVRGYVFGFREEDRTGNTPVLLPHIVMVSINPETGKVISYADVNRIPIDGREMTLEQKAFNDFLDHIDEYPLNP